MKQSKGKKCPGGYWIPKKFKCGGSRKARVGLAVGLGAATALGVAGVVATSRKTGSDRDRSSKRGRSSESRIGPPPRTGPSPTPSPRVGNGSKTPPGTNVGFRAEASPFPRPKGSEAEERKPKPESWEDLPEEMSEDDQKYLLDLEDEFGVSLNSTPAEISRAKRAAARKYHPDLHPNQSPRDAERYARYNSLFSSYLEKQDSLFFDSYPRWDSELGIFW